MHELAIIGGRLSDDADEAFRQREEFDDLVRRIGGVRVGPWRFHFPSTEQAAYAESTLGELGIKFERTELKPVDSDSGNDPFS